LSRSVPLARFIQSIRARGSLRGLARWLFLGALVTAPWLYGATTGWAIELVGGMLMLVLAIWLASFLVDRRWPRVPRALAVIVLLILLQGWWMVVNAYAIYDPTFRIFMPVRAPVSGAAGSADYVVSLAWMLRASALLGICCLVAEMAQRRVWLVRLWYGITLAGGSIALLGLVQKGTGARAIFWQPLLALREFNTFFSTFYYHANAGAFLNLVLPPIAGLTFWAWMRGSSPWARAGWLTMLLLVGLAILANTSRMAQVVGAIIILVLIAAVARTTMRHLARVEKKTLLLGFLVVLITAAAIAQAVRLDQPLRRWQSVAEQIPDNARWLANRAALPAAVDAGWFGFGPGTFRSIFPPYQQNVANLRGTWRFLHNDYLQTILEWGRLGSALIASLFFGGMATAVWNYRRAAAWRTRQRILLPCVVLALIGVAIHAAVDFPLQILSIQLFVATYLGVCWGSVFWNEERG
jgi:O-Antigen ligase